MKGARRVVSASLLSVLGIIGMAVIWSAYDPTESWLTVTLGTVLPSFLAVGLVVAGGWVAFTDDLDDGTATRMLEWSVAGMAGIGTLGGLALFLQREGYVIDQPVFVITSTVVSGALAGVGIGFYEIWADRKKRELEREREKLDHLNRLLRHHLLNGMNVLLAKVDLAREETDDREVAADLDDARVRGQEIVTLVEQVSAIAGPDDDPPGEVDLPQLLRGEVERLRATRGDDAVSLAEPLPEVTVRSSPALGEAISVLLKDALNAGGRAAVSATLDEEGEGVIVNVTAPGRASPDGGDQLLGGPGSDVGLSVADVLVERAGGEFVSGAAEGSVRIRLETV
jgi:two-component system OmpR family sensor kinase